MAGAGAGVTAKLELGEIDLEKLVATALFNALTPEKREELVRGAISELLSGTGIRGSNVLREAFARAASKVAEEHIRKELEKDGAFLAAVESVWKESWEKATKVPDREKLIERVTGALHSAFYGERRY